MRWQVSTDGGGTFADVPGETSPTLDFTATIAQDGNRYRAVFMNSAGTATTRAALLAVAPPPDTTPPSLTLPADITQSTDPGLATAAVSYAARATDDSAFTIECAPASGSAFALGTTTVSCTATDASGNSASGSFQVTVLDLEPPKLLAAVDLVVPTDPGQAYATVSDLALGTALASDNAPGLGEIVRTGVPAWNQFPLGVTLIGYSVSDAAGNSASATQQVTVIDAEPPQLVVPADLTAEATGPGGAVVAYPSASASDNVDGPLTPVCSPASGTTFPLGTTTVTCAATDSAGNTGSASFHVAVVDTTGPAVTVPARIRVDTTSLSGAVVTYSASASDLVDGALTPTCSPASGSNFPLGKTVVTCVATDSAGNTGRATFKVRVKIGPEQLEELADDIADLLDGFNLMKNVDARFENALKVIIKHVSRGRIPVACGDLDDFIAKAIKASGGKLTPDQSAQLVAAAQRTKTVLACP